MGLQVFEGQGDNVWEEGQKKAIARILVWSSECQPGPSGHISDVFPSNHEFERESRLGGGGSLGRRSSSPKFLI